MNKKRKVFGLTLLTAAFGIAAAGMTIASGYSVEVKADDNPVSGTVSTNFKTDWDSSEAEVKEGYYKLFNDGTHLPLYFDGSSTATNLFSTTINKGAATENVKIRNYGNANTNYYMYLKYSSSKTAGAVGAEIVFSATGTYKFTSVSSQFHAGYTELAIYYSNDGSSWTKTAFAGTGNAAFTYDLPVQAPYIKLAHYYQEASTFIALHDISLDFIDPENSCKVTFDSQGGTSVASQIIRTGSKASEPADPTKDQSGSTVYTFAGWHTDPVNDTPFDFANTSISSDLTLYAHWGEETLTGYTITFDSRGGTAVAPQTVPIDGESKFVKPDNPTRATDSKYTYAFKKWYCEPECLTEFDFNAVPTRNVTVYAGYGRQSFAPDGYTTIDPKSNIATWGADILNTYGALEIDTRGTIDSGTKYPAMHWSVAQSGTSNAGVKNQADNTFVLNSADMVIRITDPSKYFSNIRIEFYVLTYNSSTVKEVTIKSNGVAISETGILPHDSVINSDLALDCDCTSKPQELYFHIGYMSSNGVRLRYIYAQFGTYSTEEMAIKYATDFNDAQVCGTTASSGLDEDKWSAQATAFDALPSTVQSYLAEYDGSNAEIVEMLERYDRVVYLHGESYDFMDRITAANISTKSALAMSQGVITTNTLITVCAVFTALALTASIVIAFKKKKHE